MTSISPTTSISQWAGIHIIRMSHTDVLGADSLRAVRQYIGQLLKTGLRIKVVLDMQEIILLTSEAIGLIVALRNAMAQLGGQLHLANISDETYTVFEITKVQQLLKVFDSTKEAIEGFE